MESSRKIDNDRWAQPETIGFSGASVRNSGYSSIDKPKANDCSIDTDKMHRPYSVPVTPGMAENDRLDLNDMEETYDPYTSGGAAGDVRYSTSATYEGKPTPRYTGMGSTSAAYGDGSTINPYTGMGSASAAYGEGSTINPYTGMGSTSAAYGDGSTINPYTGMRSTDTAYNGGDNINLDHAPLWMHNESVASSVSGMSARRSAAQEEGTVNPYAQDWMPRISVMLRIEQGQSKRYKKVSFSGSLWIGTGPKCELRLNIPDAGEVCVEMTSNSGNIYARTLNPGQCGVMLDGKMLNRDLVYVRRGSKLQIGSVTIEAESIE